MADICQIQPDLARQLALRLQIKDLYKFCDMNVSCYDLVCQNNNFWRSKYKDINNNDTSQPEDWDWLSHYKKSLQSLYIITSTEKYLVSRAVVSVSSGLNHIGCLTIMGNLYLIGSNSRGQLGLPQTQTRHGWFLAQNNIKWVLCSYSYTIYTDYNADCYMTGEIGTAKYGFTLLEHNVIDAYINPFPAQTPEILYVTSDHKLYLKTNQPKFLELYNRETIFIDDNVKKICHTTTIPLYIGMDLGLHGFSWSLQKKIDYGNNIQQASFSARVRVTLNINGELYIKTKDYDQHLLATNVKEFDVTDYPRPLSMCYLTKTGEFYISGSILFFRNILVPELFKSILDSLTNENWNLIRQVLIRDRENFKLPNINTISNTDLYSYLLNLPIERQTKFQSQIPVSILQTASPLALKYPVLIDINCVHVSITGTNDILVIKDGFGPRNKRNFI